MLPARNRLRSAEDIKRVLRCGQPVRGRYLTLRWLAGGLKHSRFAFIISKKVDNRATARNRLKRMCRGLMAENIHKFKRSADVVVVAGAGLYSFNSAGVRQLLKNLLTASGLLGKVR